MMHDPVPVFAVVGHPNEGKSSVVSTLSEDDNVRIDAAPGTTIVCENYPIVVDGREILRFTDTPGFQSPKKALDWFRHYHGPDNQIVASFISAHRQHEDFRDECELLRPIAEGAGIIYVVDGSRPIRNDDRAEMEILRLTGRPRMAIINSKADEHVYLEAWKNEFRKHFNIVRVFNAHRATYRERIDLLESLKSIDQDWQPALEKVIAAFKEDWHARNIQCARLIVDMLTRCLQYRVTKTYPDEARLSSAEKDLKQKYREGIEKIEINAHQKIKKRFKHNVFHYSLPPDAIIVRDLFDKRIWQVLGLTSRQLAVAAGIAGGVLGSVVDAAAGGLTFGVFTAIGGIAGAGSALFGASRMAKAKVVGVKVGGIQLQVGPNDNLQFPFVLLDRALIYYSVVINWAHARRDVSERVPDKSATSTGKMGYTGHWDDKTRKKAAEFFISARKSTLNEESRRTFTDRVKKMLDAVSRDDFPPGFRNV
ncbi:MAG: GTPase/DUF3482 domain-containing protein [Desulfobacterales bacterium]